MKSTPTGRAGPALALLLVLAASAPARLPAQSGGADPYRVEAVVDWERQVLAVHVSLDLDLAGLRLPSGRLEAERMIERDLPGLLKDAVFSLPVDSWRTVGDTVAEGAVDVNELLVLARRVKAGPSTFSKDFRSFVSDWSLPLGEVRNLYVRHREAAPLRAPLEYRATRAYTGIVVYARGRLPVRGERGLEDSLRPSLFPRIYDEEMNLLLDRNLVAPAILVERGPAGYATELDLAAVDRVGDAPLRLAATAIFGAARTDLVVSRDDALRILSLAENRELVAAGRILILVEDPRGSLAY